MERAFNRAFERQAAGACREEEADPEHIDDAKLAPSRAAQAARAPKDADGADHEVPINAENAIPRILLYYKRRDYFRCLELPQPSCDEINRPVWSCTSSDISRGYRNISKFVHPDKNPHPQAREAFEALNAVVRALRDPTELEVLMKEAAEVAREERERKAARGSVHERIAQRAGHVEREKALKKEEGQGFDAAIKAQMRERQERFKRKKELRSRGSKFRREEEAEDISTNEAEGDDGVGDDDDNDERARRASLAKKRRKPKMIF